MEQPETILRNYKTAVQYVPLDPTQSEPFEVADEIILLLDQRERIAAGLRDRESYFLDHIEKVRRIDQELLRKRHALLALAPWYTRIRRGRDVSPSHWWWYLDQLPARRCTECQSEMNIEVVSMTMRHNGSQTADLDFLVYICPRCQAQSIPALSLSGVQVLIGSVLKRGYPQARPRTPQRKKALAVT